MSSEVCVASRSSSSAYRTARGPMMFQAQNVMAKASSASDRLRARPGRASEPTGAAVGLSHRGVLPGFGARRLVRSAVGRPHRRPAAPDGARGRGTAVAGAVDDVGAEEVVDRRGEGVDEPRERPDHEQRHPDEGVDLEVEGCRSHRLDVGLEDEQRPEPGCDGVAVGDLLMRSDHARARWWRDRRRSPRPARRTSPCRSSSSP